MHDIRFQAFQFLRVMSGALLRALLSKKLLNSSFYLGLFPLFLYEKYERQTR